jgi:prophage regulatory protein
MQVKEYPPIVKLPAVCEMTSLSKSSLYNLIKEGGFPAPKTLFSNRVAWSTHEILAWIETKMGVQS